MSGHSQVRLHSPVLHEVGGDVTDLMGNDPFNFGGDDPNNIGGEFDAENPLEFAEAAYSDDRVIRNAVRIR